MKFHCVEVSAQFHVLTALSSGTEYPIPTGQEAGRAPRADLDTAENSKMSFPCWESKSGLPVHSVMLYR
jgi:hypothetical protein